MSYQVLARKWRPGSFESLVGQEHVVQALRHALDNDRLHHGFLFTGTRGVGKTTIARIMAKCLNCEQGVTSRPCGECTSCLEIDEGRFVDLIEVDAASRSGVDGTRELMDNVHYAPTRGRYKVYLIDEVHMFSTASFNALLKTLEEPPPHIKFLLATTDPQKIPVTVLSRCLQFNLKRLSRERIETQLAKILESEQLAADTGSVRLLSRAADGSMRDALSLLDQAIAHGGGSATEASVRDMLGTLERQHLWTLVEGLRDQDPERLLTCVEDIAGDAKDFAEVLSEICSAFQRMALIQAVPAVLDDEDEDTAAWWREQAAAFSPEDVQLYYQLGLTARRDLPYAPDPRSGFEMALLRMLAFRPRDEVPPANEQVSTGRPSGSSSGGPVAGGAGMSDATPRAVPVPVREAPRVDATPTDAASDGEAVGADGECEPEGVEGQPARWRSIVDALPPGLTRELAANCVLERAEGTRFALRISTEHAALATPGLKRSLAEALASSLGFEVQLDVVTGAIATPTPAEQARAAEQARMTAAREAFVADPAIKLLEDNFGARLDPDSVRSNQ